MWQFYQCGLLESDKCICLPGNILFKKPLKYTKLAAVLCLQVSVLHLHLLFLTKIKNNFSVLSAYSKISAY